VQVTIVGLPGSGKTTVFNALTGGHAETGGFSGGRAAPNVSVVKVPDERVDRLAELFTPKKTTYADVTYVDVAIPAGAAREGTVNPDVLAQVRNADALLHVVRAFDDPANPSPADPWRDVEDLDLEFTVADLSVIEKRLEKLATQGRHGSQAEREQAQREQELLARIEPHLSEGKPIRSFGLTADEEFLLRGYRFLTQKPVLVVLNIDEGRLPEADALEQEGRERYGQPQTDVAAMAGKIEAEIGELPEDDARLFMDDLGIAEASRGRVIRLTYALLGLFSFFTAGEDECRAWTLRVGSTPTSRAASSGPRSSRSTTSWRCGPWPRGGSAASCARRARPTRSGTATCCRSSSTSDAEGLGPLHLRHDGAELVGRLDQVRVQVLHADAHRGAQLLVADVGESVRALQLAGHRLDERVLFVRLQDGRSRRLDHRLELRWGMVALRDENGVGHEVGCALVKLVEEELHASMIAP
jgi:ribosome-binding ATPase